MKSKITQRLVFTNLLILIIALFCFYMVSVYNLNSQATKQAKQQIFAESSTIIERSDNLQKTIGNFDDKDFNNNNTRAKMMTNLQELFIIPSKERDMCTHIFCDYGENGELIFPEKSIGSNKIINHIDKILEHIQKMDTLEPEVIKIDNEKYLALLTPYEIDNKILISLLAMESVKTLTTSNIISFGIVFAIIIIVSFILIYWQSMKITAPLKILTKRSEKYAKQDYSEAFAIKTGDEIESLSYSIEMMVESIISHEKSQIALFRNLSHELKTPLTAISGYAQNVQSGYYEDIKAPLTIVQEECKRIRDILDDLIFLSKIDSNIENFDYENQNLIQIITASIEKIESIAIINDIDIIYNPPQNIEILCDGQKLIRAFINILSNALKHTKDCIIIEIKEKDESVSVIISDNGAGFDESKLEKLFLTTTGESVDGNGIGILIVYEIVKKHKAKIEVRNAKQIGAEVEVIFNKKSKH